MEAMVEVVTSQGLGWQRNTSNMPLPRVESPGCPSVLQATSMGGLGGV